MIAVLVRGILWVLVLGGWLLFLLLVPGSDSPSCVRAQATLAARHAPTLRQVDRADEVCGR